MKKRYNEGCILFNASFFKPLISFYHIFNCITTHSETLISHIFIPVSESFHSYHHNAPQQAHYIQSNPQPLCAQQCTSFNAHGLW